MLINARRVELPYIYHLIWCRVRSVVKDEIDRLSIARVRNVIGPKGDTIASTRFEEFHSTLAHETAVHKPKPVINCEYSI